MNTSTEKIEDKTFLRKYQIYSPSVRHSTEAMLFVLKKKNFKRVPKPVICRFLDFVAYNKRSKNVCTISSCTPTEIFSETAAKGKFFMIAANLKDSKLLLESNAPLNIKFTLSYNVSTGTRVKNLNEEVNVPEIEARIVKKNEQIDTLSEDIEEPNLIVSNARAPQNVESNIKQASFTKKYKILNPLEKEVNSKMLNGICMFFYNKFIRNISRNFHELRKNHKIFITNDVEKPSEQTKTEKLDNSFDSDEFKDDDKSNNMNRLNIRKFNFRGRPGSGIFNQFAQNLPVLGRVSSNVSVGSFTDEQVEFNLGNGVTNQFKSLEGMDAEETDKLEALRDKQDVLLVRPHKEVKPLCTEAIDAQKKIAMLKSILTEENLKSIQKNLIENYFEKGYFNDKTNVKSQIYEDINKSIKEVQKAILELEKVKKYDSEYFYFHSYRS